MRCSVRRTKCAVRRTLTFRATASRVIYGENIGDNWAKRMIHQRPPTYLKILENGLTRRLRPKIMPILLRNPKNEPYDPRIATFTPFLRHFFGLWGLYGPFFVEIFTKEVRSNKTFHRTAHQLPKLRDVSYDLRRRPLTVAVPVRCPVELDVQR